MEPIELVRALLRRWPIIAVAAFIGALFAFLGTDPEPEPVRAEFDATHTLLVRDPEFSNDTQVGTITFAQVPVFATTGEVPAQVAEELDWPGAPAALAAQVEVIGDPDTGTVTFTTRQANPSDAVRITDAFADRTVAYLTTAQDQVRQERRTSTLATVEELEGEIASLDQELQDQAAAAAATVSEVDGVDSVVQARRDTAVREYNVAYETYRALVTSEDADINLTTLERAQPVQVQEGGFTAPRTRSTRVPIAAGFGALLGAGVALLTERLDARLRDRRRAEQAFGAAVVAELPTMSRKQRAARIVVGPEAHSPMAEAFRSLRTSVTFMAAGGQPLADNDKVGVVLITSPSPAEGKTTVASNLGTAFAETGRSVVVVNADFRRPVISTTFVPGERPGLPAGLAGIERLEPEAFLIPTQVSGVALLDLSPLGGPPGDLTRATVRLVAALAQTVDVVIVDTPPLAVTTEALEFVPESKVVVLVGRIGRTTMSGAQRAGELARFGGADQVAVALSDSGSATLKRTRYYDYYGTGRRGRRSRSSLPKTTADSTAPAEPTDDAGVDADDEWSEIDELVQRGDDSPAANGDDRTGDSRHDPLFTRKS